MLEKIVNIGSIIDIKKNLNKTAIIDLSRSETRFFSYKDIIDFSSSVAHLLVSKDIKPGDRVAILSQNSAEFVSCFFGIMKTGAIAVLINNKLTDNQIKKILDDCSPKILFCDKPINVRIETIDITDNFESIISQESYNDYIPTENDPAFILYTSGSYGDPKGAIITHHNHAWSIQRHGRYDKEWSEKRISLISAPIYHANGLTTIEGMIYGHATTVLLPEFNSRKSLEAIANFKVNTVFCVPTMIAMMFQEKDLLETLDLSSLRNIKSASSHLHDNLAEAIRKYFPNVTFTNNYGITEVGPGLFGPHPEGIPRPAGSVGYPAKGIEYRIVDRILQIKSPSMMTNYYKKEKNEMVTDDGFFITNDLFEIDENGFYYFLGRADDMFKSGGNRIYPSEVESILNQHQSVNSSFVLGMPDEIKGFKPYAFVVLKKDLKTTEQELIDFFLSKAPAYMHPRKIWFIDSFPLAGTNKVSKKSLEDLAKHNLTNGL